MHYPKIKKKQLIVLLAFIFSVLVIDLICSFFVSLTINTWYASLQKPSWIPPVWLFAFVQTFFYILMAIALFIVWLKPKTPDHLFVYLFFGIQIFLTLLGTFVFFALESTMFGLITIIFLWMAVYLTLSNMWIISKLAFWILFPYLIWVIYGISINAAIWVLN